MNGTQPQVLQHSFHFARWGGGLGTTDLQLVDDQAVPVSFVFQQRHLVADYLIRPRPVHMLLIADGRLHLRRKMDHFEQLAALNLEITANISTSIDIML